MRILAENENRDLSKGSNNQLSLRSGEAAISQACKSAIEAQRGEMQYNVNRGVPTKQTIWAGVPNQQRYQFYAIEALRGIDGVTAVERFDSDILNNVLNYEAIIKTEFGPLVIGSLIPEPEES